MANYIIGVDNISIVVDNQMFTVRRETPDGQKVIDLIRKGNATDDDFLEILRYEDRELETYCHGMDGEDGITITDATILIDGVTISDSLAQQIRLQHEMGVSIKPLVKFIRKLRKNPSYNIREQLWRFISASQQSGGFTISEDGDIIGYKKINANWTDIHSGKFDNHIGCVVKMDRSEVDDNPNHTCSAGLHFCAYSYLNSYGSCGGDDRVVLVAVNPMNVVSIPDDYNNAKARCCEYKVIGEAKNVITEPVYTCFSEDDDEEYDEEESEEFEAVSYAELGEWLSTHSVRQLVKFYNALTGKREPRKHFNRVTITDKILECYNINDYHVSKYIRMFQEDSGLFDVTYS